MWKTPFATRGIKTRIPIFQTNQVDQISLFLLEDMYFLLEAKDLNDNGYFFINQFDSNDRFDN